MFEILRKSLETGVVTTRYPATPVEVAPNARGRPVIDWDQWLDARPATRVCPTGAIEYADAADVRTASLDLGKCVFCGLCADVDQAIRMTNQCELASRSRHGLITTARYALNPDGSHAALASGPVVAGVADPGDRPQRGRLQEQGPTNDDQTALDALGAQIRERTTRLFGRSLHIREVDAGSCNGCEIEIVGLNNPIYDAERFGIHFVASPRHADMLLVTGPVTRNMELALRKTYDATPEPRLVVAVGACGCSGGMFGVNYATRGAVDAVVPVDVYIPGCPPNPHALLHGLLLALDRLPAKR
jgi:Ni,Fe-hydrogenase III small subunit/formate hydrogenlyase subunit 6/NADH:ubiquinone oxidoreductase subunit I